MIAALCDQQGVVGRAIDQSMLLIDPARPPAGKLAFQRLRLACAAKRRPQTLADQAVDLLELLAVEGLPVEVILPALFLEGQLHSTRSRAWPSPASSSATALRRRAAFVGLRSRYSVSCQEAKSSSDIRTAAGFPPSRVMIV